MKIIIKDMFPKFEFVVCAYCQELFGFSEDEVDEFKGTKSDKTISTLTCPSCNNLLILPPKVEDNIEIEEEEEEWEDE